MSIAENDNKPEELYHSMMEATSLLLNNQFLADIQFKVEDQDIYAHSHELSKRSNVFALSYKETIGSMKLVIIPNYTYSVFYEFLRYIYTDRCDITRENSISLLKLSLEYKIISLTTSIRAFLIENLAVENILEFYEFCLLENYVSPQQDLTNFISENFYVIITQNRNFLNIQLRTLIELLKFDKIDNVTRETDIYKAMLKWVKNYCLKNSLPQDGGSKRKILIDALKLIRFPTMKSEEFSRFIQNDKELLTTEEINSIFLSISLRENMNSFGFGTNPRLIGINYATGPDIKVNMRTIVGLEKQAPLKTENIHSKFTTNQNIIFTGIEIGASDVLQGIRIEFKNVSGQRLREARLDQKNQKSLKKGFVSIEFSLPFLLKPNNTYQLQINYLTPTLETYCIPSWRLQQVYAVHKNCEIKFDIISPFLLQMNFKEFK